MPQRLNRRRYQEIVRFLKKVVADGTSKPDMRMRASERLCSLYERVEDRDDRAEERAAREDERSHQIRMIELRAAAGIVTTSTGNPSPASLPDSEADTMHNVFQSLLNR